MRYKGRYVALVEIDIDFKREKEMLPFEEIKKHTRDGYLTNGIRDCILNGLIDRYGTVTVTQQYADLYEVEDE